MTKFKVKEENQKGNFARVTIEPLEAGYGQTLGNSLRRCLLASLSGGAITTVKIAGVSHQFSTMPGVKEDAIEIILNLKKVRIKIFGEKPIHMKITKTGLGEVKASDIDTLGLAEISNPNAHIATITDAKTKFNVDLTAESGVGYIGSEENKSSEIGVIPMDSIFTPILSVNYTVDQTRVGRKTDFDRLNLDITTDGTITPLEAVQKASVILAGYYKQIFEPVIEEEVEAQSTPSFISDDLFKSSIEELDLPVRITNALKAIEVDTVGKLTTVSPTHLMKAKNLGAKSLTLISEKLSERGLVLGEA